MRRVLNIFFGGPMMTVVYEDDLEILQMPVDLEYWARRLCSATVPIHTFLDRVEYCEP